MRKGVSQHITDATPYYTGTYQQQDVHYLAPGMIRQVVCSRIVYPFRTTTNDSRLTTTRDAMIYFVQRTSTPKHNKVRLEPWGMNHEIKRGTRWGEDYSWLRTGAFLTVRAGGDTIYNKATLNLH